jgi:hypothetical protein
MMNWIGWISNNKTRLKNESTLLGGEDKAPTE